MKLKLYADAEAAAGILQRRKEDDAAIGESVRSILRDVREDGDRALFVYSERFDGTVLDRGTMFVSPAEIRAAYEALDPDLLSSIRKAAANVLAYHERDPMRDVVRTEDGRTTGYVVRPVERAGIYVPGGTAPLFSSVLMGVLPAKAAGVPHIWVATPAKDGKVHPAVIAAADICGAEKILKVGGAQAIAAFAYGTESVPKADVIAGPGNIYVTLAKKEVYGQVGIDMLAGPSEILIIADGKQDPAFVAADVLSQAEHDRRARAILLTDDAGFAVRVQAEVEAQLERLPRREIAEYSLRTAGGIILVRSLDEACALANEIAPEHLELAAEDCEALLPKIRNAGAVFLGKWTSEPIGDYFAGPNHTLPTGGTARFFQVLNQNTCLRKMSVIRYTKEAVRADAADIVRLAEAEGLSAHANAVRLRAKEE